MFLQRRMGSRPEGRDLGLSLLVLAAALVFATQASAQNPPSTPLDRPSLAEVNPPALGNLVVRVRGSGGAPLPVLAIVRLYSNFTSYQVTSSTRDAAEAVFRNVPVGEYRVEVSAPGYTIANEEAGLWSPNSTSYVFVDLHPESAPSSTPSPGPPLLAPKAKQALEDAAAALRANDLKLAQQHLDRARKLVPGHPDLFFLQGLLYLRQEDLAQARAFLEQAVSIFPGHVAAQSALGGVLYRLSDFAAASAALDKAVQLEPQSWPAHRTLALCYARQRNFEKARAHLDRAVEIAGEKAPELQLVLARILVSAGEREKARHEVISYIVRHPLHPDAEEAFQMLSALGQQALVVRDLRDDKALPGPAPEARPPSLPASEETLLKAPADVPVPDVAPRARRHWAPPHVDEVTPSIRQSAACSLPALLTAVGRQVTRLAENLERVTASERIENVELDENGSRHLFQEGIFSYVVSVREVRPGILSVEEDRLQTSKNAFAAKWLSHGLAAVALVFHPYYAGGFDMRCEGLTEWRGQPAWSVYFQQRPNSAKTVRVYTTSKGRFEVLLKGRALISASNSQVLKMESDLVEPIKAIGLFVDHLVIEYQPVEFKSRKLRLWLPAVAQAYLQVGDKRYLHEHRLSQYLIFSVDVSERQGEVKTP